MMAQDYESSTFETVNDCESYVPVGTMNRSNSSLSSCWCTIVSKIVLWDVVLQWMRVLFTW